MAERDIAGNVTFQPCHIPLSELNELQPDLGSAVQKEIDRIQTYSNLVEVQNNVAGILQLYGLGPADVYIDSGDAKGETLETLFANYSRSFQFSDQFDS